MKINTESTACLYRMLYAYALKLTCGNRFLAHDLLQETLFRITERAAAYPAMTMSFTAWVKLVMKGIFHRTVPDAEKRELYHLFYHGMLNPMTEDCCKCHSLREQIHIMSRMTPQEATAMALLLNGYSLDVIAGEMGISIECVKHYLANARFTIMRTCGS